MVEVVKVVVIVITITVGIVDHPQSRCRHGHHHRSCLHRIVIMVKVVDVFNVMVVVIVIVVVVMVVTHAPPCCGRDWNVQAISCIGGAPWWWWRADGGRVCLRWGCMQLLQGRHSWQDILTDVSININISPHGTQTAADSHTRMHLELCINTNLPLSAHLA